jgi:hypothetical protein
MIQAASILGAVLILAAYAGHQGGWIGRHSSLYHLLNALGGAILFAVAVEAFQIGFMILEMVWTAISLGALVRTLRRPSGA